MKTTSFTYPRSQNASFTGERLAHSSPPEVTFADEMTPLINKDLNGRVRETIVENENESSGDQSSSSESRSNTSPTPRFHRRNITTFLKEAKIYFLFILIAVATGILAGSKEVESHFSQHVISDEVQTVVLMDRPQRVSGVMLYLRGTFTHAYFSFTHNLTLTIEDPKNKSHALATANIPYVRASSSVNEIVLSHYVDIISYHLEPHENLTLSMKVKEGLPSVPVGLDYQVLRFPLSDGIWWGAAILVLVYVLISFELVHRTVAAAIGSLLATSVLAAYNLRPTMEVILSWIDFETLMLLFGMMLIVGIFSETGFFDWVALKAYTFAHGRLFVLLGLLCGVAAVVSAFLDNVTTILLMAPVTIRLCEALRMEPQKLLLAEVIFSNIGGAATAVGDPPNVIIVSSDDLRKAASDQRTGKIDFVSFILHMGFGSVFVLFFSAVFLRFLYRGLRSDAKTGDFDTRELRREVEVWRRSAMAISMGTREETSVRALLLAKHEEAQARLRRRESMNRRTAEESFWETVGRLQSEYKIRNVYLLVKTLFVLSIVIFIFILSSVFDEIHLDLGWIAFLGAVWLLILADHHEMDALMHRVEWSTLIFFAALFTFMKCIEGLGLISFIGDQVAFLVSSVSQDYRLFVAILLVQWVSAIVSAVIDNIPFTTAMIPVIVSISHTGVPLLPLVWALAFGTCLGGNGTLIGASANVVAVGIADQHGYDISFKDFSKIGFPMMLVSNLIATFYLLVCHVSPIQWNAS